MSEIRTADIEDLKRPRSVNRRKHPQTLTRASINRTVDLMRLDIGLPVMDGYEFAQLLAQNANLRRTHLVALTGYGQATDREPSRKAGVDMHLVKPIDLPALETMLTDLASTRRAR